MPPDMDASSAVNIVTNAEVMFSDFALQSNLSVSAVDTITKAWKKPFPDSRIAQY